TVWNLVDQELALLISVKIDFITPEIYFLNNSDLGKFPKTFKKADVGGVICRLCNLSVPFHGCLLDFGTCITKPGQFCKKEIHLRGGIQWYSILGCTETQDDCFKKMTTSSGMITIYCCFRTLCNF
uniref:Uncharacterized protein n=2 Tax=Canis lupus familiaris TaxID=9615 RepID=A0A8I3MFF4_CANLF